MRHYFLLILVAIVSASCKETIETVFPNVVQSEIEQYIQKHKYMVVIYIDSATCTPCSLNHLILWRKHREELTRNKTGVLLVIQNSDEQAIINTLESIKVTFPFIIDREKKFKIKNIRIFSIARDNTFVMDKDREVIFVGSPIATEEKWNSFIKLVD
jgi:Icc-related predicted phosphoesterase